MWVRISMRSVDTQDNYVDNRSALSLELVLARAELGEFELTVCTDGTYKLDGGAMFGVVPKPLWEKRAPADDQNRILLGLNTVVVRTGKHTGVIETGIGNKQSAKMREIQCNQELLPQSLAAAGVRPEEVDVVINTHLHFDHIESRSAGGAVQHACYISDLIPTTRILVPPWGW